MYGPRAGHKLAGQLLRSEQQLDLQGKTDAQDRRRKGSLVLTLNADLVLRGIIQLVFRSRLVWRYGLDLTNQELKKSYTSCGDTAAIDF